ncbi:hypothetical protein RND81_06G163300 [Saponaria officinalis]|uniref:protein-serine/threonine phosphatase n=1 Tax=Saponaria officinalis TaxID=3572 RepID=A0AAW1KDR9_SAPOF
MESSDSDDTHAPPSSTSSSTISTLFSSSGESSNSSGDSSGGSGDIAAVAAAELATNRRCVGRQDRVSWGSTTVIGRRSAMEDAVAIVPSFVLDTCCCVGGCTAPGSRSSGDVSGIHFFGVYDGHGGAEVADFCAQRMHEVVAEEWSREGHDSHEWQKRWQDTLCSGFRRADDQVITEAGASEMVGSTAIVAVVSGCQIILSNCGDSRAVLCKRTQTIPLTVDHKVSPILKH